MIIKFKLFESLNDVTIYDVAWLYFLHYIKDGKILIETWKNDKRMGTNLETSLEKFDFVKNDGKYFISSDDSVKIIDKYFGAKTFEKSVQMKYDLLEYDIISYNISDIPYNLFLEKNKNIDNAFDKIGDKIVDHFNSQISKKSILEKLSKMRYIDKYNYKTAMDHFNGKIPEKLNIFRGIKCEYNSSIQLEYSCWTIDYKQAERFAKYRFTGGYQNPIISPKQYILVSTVSYDDIAVFIGKEESEIIMKGDINVDKIIDLKNYNESKL